MAKIVFRLNNVPEEEAELVRELLTVNDIAFYETHGGRWGISVAAIWLNNNDEFEHARSLIEAFQVEHSLKMRNQFNEDLKNGLVPTFWQLLSANPVMFVIYWLLIAAVIAVTILPVYHFFN